MSKIRVHLFAEDNAHEKLLCPMIARIAREENRNIDIRVMSARGGHGKVLSELDLFQDTRRAGQTMPDILVVGIDANCQGFAQARQEILDHLRAEFAEMAVIACPNPHIERWYLADAVSFHEVVGGAAPSVKEKCQRDHFKRLLAEAVRKTGRAPTLGGIEFADELAGQMDYFRAGKTDPAIKHFVEDLRAKFRQSSL
jgi:hypothetical protein